MSTKRPCGAEHPGACTDGLTIVKQAVVDQLENEYGFMLRMPAAEYARGAGTPMVTMTPISPEIIKKLYDQAQGVRYIPWLTSPAALPVDLAPDRS